MSTRKAIFITGGGSGIGRAIAEYFAERGWFVGLGDIDRAGMRETEKAIGNGFVYSHGFDVRDRAEWDRALDGFSIAAGGRIDVVANNAGVPISGQLDQLTVEEIDRCIDINLKGVLYGAQAALPHLKKTAPGSCLLNTASAAGIYGMAGASVYAATKFGVRGLTESLDADWDVHGIKVHDLCPAFIDTPLLHQTPNKASNQSIKSVVNEAGLEITPAREVAQAAWDSVHGDRLHMLVGKTAYRMAFASRWMPGRMRRQARQNARGPAQ